MLKSARMLIHPPVEIVAPIYSLNKVNTSVAPGENGRLDGETRVQLAGQGGKAGQRQGDGSWMLAKKKTEGRKEGILQGKSGGTPNAIHVPTAFKY